MRILVTIVVGLAMTGALWLGGPGPAFADDKGNGQGNCDPAQPFVPGTSFGPVRIGMPLDAVQRWYGRPRSVERQSIQGHQWTHMLFSGLNVVARDNTVVALNLVQLAGAPLQSSCGAPLARPYNFSVANVQQIYGPPSSTLVLNGLQYLLYNSRGLMLTVPVGGGYVQGLTVYPAGGYCEVVPVLVHFGGFAVYAGNTVQCSNNAGERER